MKNKIFLYLVLLPGLLMTLLTNCKKEAVATIVTLSTVTDITSNSATSGGNISTDGGASVTARGVCWATTQNPTTANTKTTDGTGTGTFISNLKGLFPGTSYYLRAYATNSVGTSYGDEIPFKTLAITYGTMSDNDGNVYRTITIGTQVWMADNLKTTKYRSGDVIPNVTLDTSWKALTTGAYCWYNNDAATYKADYGALYNWYAVADNRNIAPIGWHVPTDAEWTLLTDYLGEIIAGSMLKETGVWHWQLPNTDATNSSGFTALPGGYRKDYDGTFSDLRQSGNWWSSTAYDAFSARDRSIFYNFYYNFYYNFSFVGSSPRFNQCGFSVRCVRD